MRSEFPAAADVRQGELDRLVGLLHTVLQLRHLDEDLTAFAVGEADFRRHCLVVFPRLGGTVPGRNVHAHRSGGSTGALDDDLGSIRSLGCSKYCAGELQNAGRGIDAGRAAERRRSRGNVIARRYLREAGGLELETWPGDA